MNVHTGIPSAVHYTDIQTDKQTDRQDRQTRKTKRPTDRRTNSILVSCKKIRSKFAKLRTLDTRGVPL
jgi:hypothetical protein